MCKKRESEHGGACVDNHGNDRFQEGDEKGRHIPEHCVSHIQAKPKRQKRENGKMGIAVVVLTKVVLISMLWLTWGL